MKRLFKNWFIPFAIASFVFVFVQPVLAQTANTLKNVQVGEEVKDGFSRVYYLDGGTKTFIGLENENSKEPDSNGEYITWATDINDAGGQIFLYNISTRMQMQLTYLRTNLNPKVDDKGRVTWEGWDGNTWQAFFFDGKSVRQLTTGDTTVNPDFGGEYISYGRRDTTGTWRAVIYSIKEEKSVDVAVGEEARTPKIKNGEIYLAADSLAEAKFPLSVSDLFLLNLTPLTATKSAEASSSASILNELSASPSAVMEIPLAPQSTSSGQLEALPSPSISE